MQLSDIRNDYTHATLDETGVDKNPLKQLTLWLEQALHSKVAEPTAMTLATRNAEGVSARIVLAKMVDEEGLCWFTNYESEKGIQLAAHGAAALLFFWPELERQVRIEGVVTKTSRELSIKYFASRPLASQVGAIVSKQSQVLTDRAHLDSTFKQQFEQAQKQALEQNQHLLPAPDCPTHWGGYRLTPHLFEFWQGRRSRLHDRLRYRKTTQQWHIQRLYP